MTRSDWRCNANVALGLLVLGTLAVYWRSLGHEFIDFDDDRYVTANSMVGQGFTWAGVAWAFTTFTAANWHPLTWLSHMLDVELFGLDAGGHHATSVFFHLANTVLLFSILTRMTRAPWRSLAVAALFALHPLHVESVAWVSERKDVLSTFFGLLAVACYARYAERHGGGWYVCVVILFALSLLSKPMLVTLPCLLLLLDVWPLNRLQPGARREGSFAEVARSPGTFAPSMIGRLLAEKVPLFILSAASSVMTVIAQQAMGAISPLETIPFRLRVANAVVAYAAYLWKTVWPVDLAVIYPHPVIWPVWTVVISAGVLAAITVLVWWKRNVYPQCLVGWLWYLGTLVPVIGLAQVGTQALADRYTYVPLIGLFIMAAWSLPDRVWPTSQNRLRLMAGGAIVLTLLAVRTWDQLGIWRNSFTLFEHTLAVTGGNYIAHHNLGVAHYRAGAIDRAIKQFEAAARINPNHAETHDNLGQAYLTQGRYSDAAECFQNALALLPESATIRVNLGVALFRSGRPEDAIEQCAAAVRIDPKNAMAHANWGNALASLGRLDEAIEHYRTSLELNPEAAETYHNLGSAYVKAGRFDEAVAALREAIRLDPEQAMTHATLGRVLIQLRQYDEAAAACQEALRLRADLVDARVCLGIVAGVQGQLDDAIAHFQDALRLQPDHAEAQQHLQNARRLKDEISQP